MKTFDEAIHFICLAKKGDIDKMEQVLERQRKRLSIIKEVCESPETLILIILLMKNANNLNSQEELEELLTNAIAQGVLIGMEMEKVD